MVLGNASVPVSSNLADGQLFLALRGASVIRELLFMVDRESRVGVRRAFIRFLFRECGNIELE
ncbi:hypothetical protein MXD62_07495 [Frankia sp. Mgl5]|uniref:hypothetical protein n=1 Tax=Frankia sp. Mgl5 TaxID=2933793 RepID=UPI00200BC59F|nr:hypothetical protein [Frankia sp. Mgl5]MCK9927010.1 hypothetical protein [Frankia sp. Mgl5]